MIPDDNDNNSFDTPKCFKFGYFCRESLELFYEGWTVATRDMREDRRFQQASEDRKHIQELLESALYDSSSRGTPEQQIEALKYLQRKKEFEQQQDQRPYTWGEQISSLALNGAFLSALAIAFSFATTWTCGRNQSQFCQDVRATTGGVVRYFSNPKL
ncbi:MAG: hypothetical protein F6K28_13870 [Microcoleus sp. SIO2G3]|nr:hypothetical protein [Microcoleus sp. SIO2G3]